MQSLPSLSLSLVLVAAPAAAQQIVPLVLEGDPIPGVDDVIVSIENIGIDDSGGWFVDVETDNPDTGMDEVIVRASGIWFQEGQALAQPPGTTLGSFGPGVLDRAGNGAFAFGLGGTAGGTTDNAGVYWNDLLVLQKGEVSIAPGFTPGTVHGSFSSLQVNDSNQILMVGLVDDPAIPGTTDWYAAIATHDGAGNLLSLEVIAKEGDVPPGQTLAINTVRSASNASAINNAGDVIWCADLDTASPPMDAVVYLNGTVIAQEGMPSPVAGLVWGDLVSPEVDLNDAGDWTIKDRLDTGGSTDGIIVKNGAKFRQEGDTLPAIAPFVFTSFGNGACDLTDSGSVLWYGDWDDPDTSRDEGLFLDDVLLVQQGVTQVNGLTVIDVGDQARNYYVARNGAYIVFEATLEGGIEGAFLLFPPVGTSFCTSTPNSTGAPALISASGSTSVATGELTLSAGPVPNQPFLFFHGANTVQIPFGNGFLCASGGIQRLNPPMAASDNLAQRVVDLAAAGVAPGTRHFQCWFRDPLAGGAAFNTSNGVSITFVP